METLEKVKDGHFMFRQEHWGQLSEEARDFISKLIVVDASSRMDVRQALRHPWLNYADMKPTEDTPRLNTDALRNYYNLYKDWTGQAAVRRHYRHRPLSSCYTHPSRMIYPSGTSFTPEPTPERQLVSRDLQSNWEAPPHVDRMPPVDYDLNVVKSESHYQNGPDTYLLQLRDVDFPCRLREYIKVASTRPGFNCLDTSDNGHLDWQAPVIRERRRFTDVMDEEIDDERRNRINKYGAADTYTLRRLRHETGTRPEAHVEADALIESRRDGHAPFFREKPNTIPVVIGDKIEMKCLAVGEPKPILQWFKNELVITESARVKFREDKEGRCIMTIEPVLNADLGIFKIVARNKKGQTVTRCRVVEATTPMAPDSPEAVDIADTEILLRWKQPSYDGHAPVICYSLQYKEADEVEWISLANNIDHEFWHVKDLKRETNYVFRLSAKNSIGWSEKGIPSALFKTKPQDNGQYKVAVTPAMRHIQSVTESGHTPSLAQAPPPLNYSVEDAPVEWSSDTPTDKYQFISEIYRGKFSVVVKATDKSNREKLVAAKLFEYSHETLHQVNNEFDNLRSLRHERIANLIEAFKPSTTASNIAVLVMEKLQGADVLTYLSSRHEFTEQNVATIVSQVLDGLQYLHWRGLCHLNLEPDNVVMASVRSIQVKIIDLGCAQRVTKMGTLIHAVNTPNPEFSAPELLAEEPIYPQTDVWNVGALAYVLLSGASPFRGTSDVETKQNINFVRYRFEYLFKELTQEATRFLISIFKRAPNKRPTVEECHENRWLVPSEYMIKKRERAVFLGNRLKEFSDEYHDLKNKQYTSDSLSALHKTLTRSNSIQDELLSSAFTSHLINKPRSDSSTL